MATAAFSASPECPVARPHKASGLGYHPADFSCAFESICSQDGRIHLTHYPARLLELYLDEFGEDIQRLEIDSVQGEILFSICLTSGLRVAGRYALNSCTSRIYGEDIHLQEGGDCVQEPQSIADAPAQPGSAPPDASCGPNGATCARNVHVALDQRLIRFVLRSMAEEPSLCTGAKTKDRSGIHSLQISEYDYGSCSDIEVQKNFSILDYLCGSFFFEDDSIMYCREPACPEK